MTIYGRPITQDDMNNIAGYMDDDTREELHSELAPCEPEEFIKAYLERDPDFIEILETEFDYEDNKYILFDDCGTEIFTDEYDTEAEAIDDAERVWRRLTKYDKNRRREFYVGFGTVDNHDEIKRWK